MKLSETSKRIISDIVTIPTAPFHEHKVISYVTSFCIKNGFNLKQDKFGNIFISYQKGRASQLVVFVAHMDHPGFEVLSVKGKSAEVGIMGGIKYEYFLGSRVKICSNDDLISGKVTAKLSRKWKGKPVFRIKTDEKIRKGDFGYYDLTGVKLKENLIYTKSADNLASTALLLNLLLELKKKKTSLDVTILLTRAEEVGFAGCISVANGRHLKKRVPIIVVETSDAVKGGVEINGGPVIRVGDKQSGFMPEVDCWMQMIAENLSQKSKSFKYQRALLSGGRCEASALMLKNYLVGGLAFPLGNYHNNGKKGSAPEYIGQDDYMNMLQFVIQLSKGPKIEEAFERKKKELWSNYRKWEKKF